MRLQEEYFKRHNITLPPVYHVRNANLILKIHTRPQVVLNIQWQQNDKVPGHYVFNFLRPNHNGYLSRKYFLNMAEAPYIHQYDEYRKFVVNWAKNLNFTPIKLDEVRLAIWEMFLYCFDGWFADNPELEEMVFSPVDLNLSLRERNEALDKLAVLQYRYSHKNTLWSVYEKEFKKFELNYADWLADLIKFYAGDV